MLLQFTNNMNFPNQTRLIVLVFQKGDDLIDAINHMMSFLTAVVSSRYPTTNNQLRNSSNLRQQATIDNGRVTLQLIKGIQTSFAAGTLRTYTSGASGNNSRKQRAVIYCNCKGKGHMSKHYTYDSDCDEINSAKVALMENLSHYGLDNLAEVAIQNSNSPIQQDALILSVIDQLKPQVLNCTKINLDNKSVNDTLTAELERYKDQDRILKEGQNVDLKSKDNGSDSCALSNSMNSPKPTPSSRPTKVEVPKERPKVSMDQIKKELEEIETINIELDHRVTKLIAENDHLKQTYKQLYDSIKSLRIRSKEKCDDLINQVNLMSAKNSDLNASLQQKVLEFKAVKDNIRKLKEKSLLDDAVTSHPIDLKLLKVDVALLAPKLQNNRITHSDYLKHTQKETVTLREIVEHRRSLNPLNTYLDLRKTVKRKVWKPTGKVFTNIGYIWRPTGRTFTKVRNECPLTMITTPAEVPLRKPIALEKHAESTGSPSSTTVNQDAPSPSNSQTTPEPKSSIIPNDVEDDNHNLNIAHMNNDPFFGIPIPEVPFDQSSSTDSIHIIMHPDHQISKHNSKWTKDHPLENIIVELARPVSTRLQLHEQALFCYYDAFLTFVEPKTYKDALTQSDWIKAAQE
nr:integrase, catalytic region, zinc finger, CCHC-type, peptidase aspartic, catalytic [Tanacetum cinerariifolium]